MRDMRICTGSMARRMVVCLVLMLSLTIIAIPGSADTSDPAITSIPETSVTMGHMYSYEIETGAAVEGMTVVRGPQGLELTDEVLTWTPQKVGSYDIEVMVTSRSGDIATQSFTLRVLPKAHWTPELVILGPLPRSSFGQSEDIEIRGAVASPYQTLELTPVLDGKDLKPVQITGHGDWVLWLEEDMEPGKHGLTLKVGEEGGPHLNEASLEFEVEREPLRTETVYLASVPFFLGLLSVGMFALCDVGVYSLSSFFIMPLYSRLKPEKVLDKYIRGRIFEYIKNNPGATYNNIKRGVDLSNGCLTYHLRVLDRSEMIHSKRNGTFRHFYPKDMPLPKVVFRLSPPQKSILQIMDERPGISQTDIAREAGMTPTALNYHIKLLWRAGIISVKRKGKETRCFLLKEEVPSEAVALG